MHSYILQKENIGAMQIAEEAVVGILSYTTLLESQNISEAVSHERI